MFKTKKYRALERERDKYKAEAERLAEELADANATIQAYREPPEGCRVGNWCKGCRYANTKRQLTVHYGMTDEVIGCLYGACNHRLPEETRVPFTGCL